MADCRKCEEKITKKSPDPDFCHGCYQEIEDMCNNPMPHVRAVRGLADHSNMSQRQHVYAFLSIFHPKMSHRRKMNILQAVPEG